jgi:hypothetical protein
LKKQGFIPGERVHFDVKIVNQSRSEVIKSELKLILRGMYKANDDRTYVEEIIIGKMSSKKVNPGDEFVSEDNYFDLPTNLIPTMMGGHCPVMHTAYVFQVCMYIELSNLHNHICMYLFYICIFVV